MNTVTQIRDLIFGATMLAFVFTISLLFPLIGSFTLMFTPVPLIFYYAKLGRIKGLLLFAIALLQVCATLLFAGAYFETASFIVLGVFGIAIAEALLKKLSIEKIVTIGTFIIIAPVCIVLAYISFHLDASPWQVVEKYITKSIQESVKTYEGQWFQPADVVVFIKANINDISHMFTKMFPSFIVLLAFFTAIANATVGRVMLEKINVPCSDFNELSLWKAPENLVWFFIASASLTIFAPYEYLQTIGLNVLILCATIYVMQGFAIV
ncbi:MAG: DUF2232 domain-containing protein, partial [Deltaproteobacteria bacterium]